MDSEIRDFESLGLSPRLVARLADQGINDPTPIQAQAIPHALKGRDVLGLAQTGTGKTAAFGLPLIHGLSGSGARPDPKTASGLILAPTRELARQIVEHLRALTRGSHLRIELVTGGASINNQVRALHKGVDVLVATPGRLIDLLDRKAVRLDLTSRLVLDEADQMLDMGFIHALRRIAPLLPRARQTMLFSATMPAQMEELSRAFLTDPVRVEVAPPGKVADRIEQSVHFVPKADKVPLLIDMLGAHKAERSIVFARTKHGAERLMKKLVAEGFAAASIHGNKTQGQRDRAIAGFKGAQVKVLVATDVAARGIDIPGVAHVYNYDLPNVPENYVHRIGRTARAGAEGRAIAFCAEDEAGELAAIQKILPEPLRVAGGTPWKAAQAAKGGKPGGGGGRGGQQQQRRRRRSGGGGQGRGARQAA
ncbi:DEAD/DEAH box helicase [Halovulum marinum]|nr:DEAD/DEAH box helicase [Halovulum marinum]